MVDRRGRGVRASRRLLVAALSSLALAGCASPLAPSAFEGGTPAMRPERFFAGTTRSTGVLANRSGEPVRRLRVEGRGATLPDGSFRLEQTVAIDDRPVEHRAWVMKQVDAHRYTATLTDASGPVEGEAWGDVFHLRYPMKSPPGGRMEQWLYLQPDGRTVVNEATVTVLGLVVAHVSERITRDEGGVEH